MILDFQKTIEALISEVIKTGLSIEITADSLDSIQLVAVSDDDIVVENEHYTQYPLIDLSQNELELFCRNYIIKPVYDLEASYIELRNYYKAGIIPYSYDKKNELFIQLNGQLVKVKNIYIPQLTYINRNGTLDTAYLMHLTLDELRAIYNFQNKL
jgi:hypothetical protein